MYFDEFCYNLLVVLTKSSGLYFSTSTSQLFLYPSKGASAGMYILYQNVWWISFQISKQNKKTCVKFACNICCSRNTATFFYCVLSRVPKKKPAKILLQVVFKFIWCIFENLSEHGFELATCSPEKSHHIYTSTTSPLPINFFKYINILFL